MSQAIAAEEEDDAALIARCLEDDPRAWESLVRRFGPLVWTAVRRVGLRPEDAADVYQTVWVAALQGISRLRQRDRFGSWLARVAHVQAVRVVRDRSIARRALGRISPPEFDESPPDEEIGMLEDRRRVSRAVARLGPRCRTLLRVLYYESPAPSYAEVSARLEMPVGSIGPTRARCLGKLEREFERS